ncbi:unnamed protein product [Sphagnum jensenii]|uniref:Apple domain-containing protein n=1 Tax=Sphagnum jensenii TaxID=128206 RepID=A0ABP0VFG0_9BRYO
MVPIFIALVMRTAVEAQNCFGGIETFEKTSMTDFDGNFSPAGTLLQQPDQALTRDCVNLCRQQPTCLSFGLDYTRFRCAAYSVNSIGRRNNLLSTNTTNFFEKVCYKGVPREEFQKVCGLERLWAFERVKNAFLDGFEEVTRSNIGSKEECAKACLMETGFTCRSADYDYVTRVCHLSREDRRTQPQAFRQVAGSSRDYIENQCAAPGLSTAFFEAHNFHVEHKKSASFDKTKAGIKNERQIQVNSWSRLSDVFDKRKGPTTCLYNTKRDVGVITMDSLVFALNLEDCQLKCDKESTFNCRSFSIADKRCFLSGDDTVSLTNVVLPGKQGSIYGEKKCVTENCVHGIFTYEKITGYVLRSANTVPIESVDSGKLGITMLCREGCDKELLNCPAFTVNYQSSRCDRLDRNTQGRSLDLVPRDGENYFEKICLRVPEIMTMCQDKYWAFERVLGHELTPILYQRVYNYVQSRRDCEEYCLQEKLFVCRSALYNDETTECKLSKEDRRTKPANYVRNNNPKINYLENQCIPSYNACPLVEYENGYPTYTDLVESIGVTSKDSCEKYCNDNRRFLCRSFSFYSSNGQCFISGDDHISGGTSALQPRSGMTYYERKCDRLPDPTSSHATGDPTTPEVTHSDPIQSTHHTLNTVGQSSQNTDQTQTNQITSSNLISTFPSTNESPATSPPYTTTERPISHPETTNTEYTHQTSDTGSVKCGANHKFTFERIPGFEPIGGYLMLLYSDISSPGIVTECARRCEAHSGCRAFVVDYHRRSCNGLFERSSVGLLDLRLSRGKDYFEGFCMPSFLACKKLWTYDRILDQASVGVQPKSVVRFVHRTECRLRCLEEKRFQCLSASYDATLRECRLFDQDKNTGNMHLHFTKGTDYLENTCSSSPETCKYLPIERDITITTITKAVRGSSTFFCEQECNQEKEFNCRSYTYIDQSTIPGANICILSADSRAGSQRGSMLYRPRSLYAEKDCRQVKASQVATTNTSTTTSTTTTTTTASPSSVSSTEFLNTGSVIDATTTERSSHFTRPETATEVKGTTLVIDVDKATEVGVLILTTLDFGAQSVFENEIKSDVTPPHSTGNTNRKPSVPSSWSPNQCPTDPSVFPALKLDFRDKKSLYSTFKAFRFPSTGVVNFEVQVRYCHDYCEPAKCGNGIFSYGRRRKRNILEDDSIEYINATQLINITEAVTTPTVLTKKLPVKSKLQGQKNEGQSEEIPKSNGSQPTRSAVLMRDDVIIVQNSPPPQAIISETPQAMILTTGPNESKTVMLGQDSQSGVYKVVSRSTNVQVAPEVRHNPAMVNHIEKGRLYDVDKNQQKEQSYPQQIPAQQQQSHPQAMPQTMPYMTNSYVPANVQSQPSYPQQYSYNQYPAYGSQQNQPWPPQQKVSYGPPVQVVSNNSNPFWYQKPQEAQYYNPYQQSNPQFHQNQAFNSYNQQQGQQQQPYPSQGMSQGYPPPQHIPQPQYTPSQTSQSYAYPATPSRDSVESVTTSTPPRKVKPGTDKPFRPPRPLPRPKGVPLQPHVVQTNDRIGHSPEVPLSLAIVVGEKEKNAAKEKKDWNLERKPKALIVTLANCGVIFGGHFYYQRYIRYSCKKQFNNPTSLRVENTAVQPVSRTSSFRTRRGSDVFFGPHGGEQAQANVGFRNLFTASYESPP